MSMGVHVSALGMWSGRLRNPMLYDEQLSFPPGSPPRDSAGDHGAGAEARPGAHLLGGLASASEVAVDSSRDLAVVAPFAVTAGGST